MTMQIPIAKESHCDVIPVLQKIAMQWFKQQVFVEKDLISFHHH